MILNPGIEENNETKLERIYLALQDDPRVFVAGEPILGGSPQWALTANIIVAPNVGILDMPGNRLNEFMFSLVPDDLEFSTVDRTQGWSRDSYEGSELIMGRRLSIPKLYFDEERILDGKAEKCRTWVRVYPNQIAAEFAYNVIRLPFTSDMEMILGDAFGIEGYLTVDQMELLCRNSKPTIGQRIKSLLPGY